MAALRSGRSWARLGEEARGLWQAVRASRAMRWQATQQNSAGGACSSTANGKPPHSGSYSNGTDEEAADVFITGVVFSDGTTTIPPAWEVLLSNPTPGHFPCFT